MTDTSKSGRKAKKYVLVIIDGAADYPIKELANKTPLQAAYKPQLDKLTMSGKYGTVLTVPRGFSPGSDVAIMSLLGYDPAQYYTGRAPLEAAAQNLVVKASEWVFRCNLVVIEKGIMKDHSAGNIPTPIAERFITLLNERIKNYPVHFYSGVSYRNLMFYEGELDVTTTPPHDILERPVNEYLPQGKGAAELLELIKQSQSLFSPDCLPSALVGSVKANSIWLWGQGRAVTVPRITETYGISGWVV
jgi:2,3-bisphosphoglycerate-independent phosphoglycerate mutase